MTGQRGPGPLPQGLFAPTMKVGTWGSTYRAVAADPARGFLFVREMPSAEQAKRRRELGS